MRSPKAVKGTKKAVKCCRNKNARKWKLFRRQLAAAQNWIQCSVTEPGQHKIPKPKSLALSPIIVPRPAKNAAVVEPKQKKANKPNENKANIAAQSKLVQNAPAKKAKNASVSVADAAKKPASPQGREKELVVKIPPPASAAGDKKATQNGDSLQRSAPSPPLTNCSTADSGIGCDSNNVSPNIALATVQPLVASSAENGLQKNDVAVANGGKIFGDVLRVMDDQRRSRSPRSPRQSKLLPKDIEYCVYMLEKHGDDFEKMSRDEKNVYKDPPEMIARKLRIFRESPYFAQYKEKCVVVEMNGGGAKCSV